MRLVLSEDQELLAKTAADFVAEKSPLQRVRALRDAGDPEGFSRALWKEMGELGWLGIPFAEELGGAELGIAEVVVVLEALGRTLAPEPYLSTVLLAGGVLRHVGNAAPQQAWLPRVCAGETVLAFAQQEPESRFDLHRVAFRAPREGEAYRLDGEKIAVLDGAAADAFVVVARTSGEEDSQGGISLFLVPADAAGLSVQRNARLDSRNAAGLRAQALRLPADALLGAEGDALPILERITDEAAVCLSAEMLGSMSEGFERTLSYLRDRKQFGVPIGSFQALKHRAADLFVEIELCRSAVMAAARALDEGAEEAPRLASLAKARCSETAIQVANEAVQMHGGIGMTDEHEIGFFLKRARVAELTLGDAAWHRERWARLGGY